MGRYHSKCSPLTTAEINRIDTAARKLLVHTGVKIIARDDTLFDHLRKAGARTDTEQRLVFFDQKCLDTLLAAAPSHFTLYSRNGTDDIVLGTGLVHFANGGRVFRLIDSATGDSRSTELGDISRTASLVEHLDNIRIYIIACEAHDLQGSVAYHVNDFFQALSHTNKHVMGGCATLDDIRQVERLVHLIAGGEKRFRDKPCISIITNPISPLTFSHDTLQVLQFCAMAGIPVTCAPAPNAGATAPGTLAGTLVQMHAEALAGVAMAQAFAHGAKVLYGAVPTTMDLRKMNFSIGSVETAMLNAAAVQLAHRYNLPIYASAGGTEAKRPDFQAGMEKCLSNLLVALSGADFIHLAAGMLDSANSICYEQYVIDDELIGMVRHLLTGIRVDRETSALDVIKKVGPGGNYMTEEHTIAHMMEEFFYPQLAVRSLFDVWDKEGRPDMVSRARKRVGQILSSGGKSVLQPELIAQLRKAFPELIIEVSPLTPGAH